jgi:hypothetical protein
MTGSDMTDEQMTAEQFSDLISAYGGAADRWPETQRTQKRKPYEVAKQASTAGWHGASTRPRRP